MTDAGVGVYIEQLGTERRRAVSEYERSFRHLTAALDRATSALSDPAALLVVAVAVEHAVGRR